MKNAQPKDLVYLSPASRDMLLMISNDPGLMPVTKKRYLYALNRLFLQHPLEELIVKPELLTTFVGSIGSSPGTYIRTSLKKWIHLQINRVKSGVVITDPRQVLEAQAKIWKLEALLDSCPEPNKPKKRYGKFWLTHKQVAKIFRLCPNTPVGFRDMVTFGLLLGCGLRLTELLETRFKQIVQQPRDGELHYVLEVIGKRNKYRSIELSDELYDTLMDWKEFSEASRNDYIIRAWDIETKWFKQVRASNRTIRERVWMYGEKIGIPELSPHSFRRTFAALDYETHKDLNRTKRLLGHVSIATTQAYLRDVTEHDDAPSNYIQSVKLNRRIGRDGR